MSGPRCILLVNRQAGGGRRLGEVARCAQGLIAHGWSVEIRTPEDRDSLREQALDAVQGEVDGLIVCGGDGTWHDALQVVAGTTLPMGLLPIGTGDDNARSLGFPSGNPEGLVELMAGGRNRTIDLGRITWTDPSGVESIRWFSGIASIGFDSQVNARANTYRRLPGTLRYLAAAAAELTVFEPGRYTITGDAGTSEVEAMLIAVGNGGYYGGGMAICPDYQLDDGLLDATIIHRLPRWRFVKTLPTVYRGTHVHDAAVATMRSSSLIVEGQDQLVFADGEYVGRLPVRMESVPQALVVVSA